MIPRPRLGGRHGPSHSPTRPEATGSPRGPEPGAAQVCWAGPGPCVPPALSTAGVSWSPPPGLSVSLHLSPPHPSLHAPTPLSLVSLSPGHRGSCLLSVLPCWAFCSRGQSAPLVCEDHIPSPLSPWRSSRPPHSPSLGPPFGDGPFPWVRPGFPRRARGAWAGAGSGEKSTTRPPKPGRSPLGDWVPQTPKDEPPLKSSQGSHAPDWDPGRLACTAVSRPLAISTWTWGAGLYVVVEREGEGRGMGYTLGGVCPRRW